MKYIDAHCHLQDAGLNIAATIRRAESENVVGYICNSAAQTDWHNVITLCNQYPSVHGCIGIHPWHINNLSDDWQSQLINILSDNPTLMVGEIGIDNNYPNTETQIDIFTAQIDIAYKLHRPAHIHCVGAWDKMLHIFKSRMHRMPPTIVLHSFAGPSDIINQCADKYNAYFSYSPMILDSRRHRLHNAVLNTPTSRILCESDCADPSVVPDVVSAVAQVKILDHNKLADIIYNNTLMVLKYG